MLLPIAAFATLVALGLHAAAMSSELTTDNRIYYLIWGGNLITFAWILGLFAINYVVTSTPMIATYWAKFFAGKFHYY